MQMLIEVIHDLLTVLLVVGIGTVIFVWCAAVRLQTRVAWQWMDDPNHSWSRGGLALFPGVSWPEKYQKQRRQLVTMYIGFFAGSAVCTLLMFLVNATAKTYPAC